MKHVAPDDCSRAYMTIRTLMTGQALAGYLAAHADVTVSIPSDETVARRAVDIADAVIERLNEAK